MKITLLKIKKAKGNKKYTAELEIEKDGIEEIKTRSFGYVNPDDLNNDYTRHKDKERRNRYIIRSKSHLKTGDPTRAGFLSMFLLWNKPTLKSSVEDYNQRLKIYNKTGTFPTEDLIEEAKKELEKAKEKKKELAEAKDKKEKLDKKEKMKVTFE